MQLVLLVRRCVAHLQISYETFKMRIQKMKERMGVLWFRIRFSMKFSSKVKKRNNCAFYDTTENVNHFTAQRVVAWTTIPFSFRKAWNVSFVPFFKIFYDAVLANLSQCMVNVLKEGKSNDEDLYIYDFIVLRMQTTLLTVLKRTALLIHVFLLIVLDMKCYLYFMIAAN